MLHLILGGPGSGKTTVIERELSDAVAAGRPSRLVVPEQATVSVERRMAELLPPSAPLCFEVSNFTRLADSFFRVNGGLGVTYATPTARLLTMWKTVTETAPFLNGARHDSSAGTVRKLLSASRELSSSRTELGALDAAANALGEGKLSERVRDLSLLLSTYRALLGERFADAETDLDAMAEGMRTSDFFSGVSLAFDSFTSFTEQQYAVIAELLRTSDVTVSLTLPRDADAYLCYEEAKETRRRLLLLAERANIPVRESLLGANRRTLSEPLRHLSDNLWRIHAEGHAYAGELDSSVRYVNALTPYAAARFIADDICRRVQTEGARYCDFAVVARDTDGYRSILDSALRESGIPVFSSDRTDVSALEPFKLIVSAYAACTGGFRRSDVLTYLKCGYSGVSVEAIDAFELYTERWHLDGKRLTDSKAWTMNPDGYTDRVTEHGGRMLALANTVREHLTKVLLPFCHRLKRAAVPTHCRVLCDFLLSIKLPTELRARAARLAAAGESERGELISRIWEILCEALDTLAELLPDSTVTPEEFASLFRLVGEEVDVGRIPASEDEVVFGSAELLRAEGVRHVYLLGVNEGEFPAAGGETSFFTEHERTALAAVGIRLGQSAEVRSSRELFFFLRALTSASVSATVLTASLGEDLTPRRPSAAVRELCALLGERFSCREAGELQAEETLWSRGGALERLGELARDPIYPSLAAALGAEETVRERTAATETPISNDACSLSPALAKEIYPKRMATTQSRIERYVKCPFLHFCQYVLRLHTGELAEFDSNEIGSYIHAMLEEFFRESEGRPLGSYTAKEIDAISRRLSEAYLKRIGQGQENARMRRLWRSLHRSSRLLISRICEELSESDFAPRFYELKIGGKEPDAPTAYTVETEDGGELSVYGSVDRVDTCVMGGRAYVRVIDYKTGAKVFQLDDVSRGMNLQMLLYLFALWKNRNPAFAERLGIGQNGEIIPAGVLYMGAGTGEIRIERPTSDEEVLRLASLSSRQNGLLLDDRAVLEAMEHGLRGKYIPVKLTTDKKTKEQVISKDTQKNLMSLEGMGKLLTEINGILTRITAEMRSGRIPAYAVRHGQENCSGCEMRPVCRVRISKNDVTEE